MTMSEAGCISEGISVDTLHYRFYCSSIRGRFFTLVNLRFLKLWFKCGVHTICSKNLENAPEICEFTQTLPILDLLQLCGSLSSVRTILNSFHLFLVHNSSYTHFLFTDILFMHLPTTYLSST